MRLLVYDKTDRRLVRGRLGLSTLWAAGAFGYGTLAGRFDASFGAASWDEALDWLVSVRPGEGVEELQVWSHGKWGEVRIGSERLDVSAFSPDHRWFERCVAFRERLVRDDPSNAALLWFRCCEVFGAAAGQRFAAEAARFFGARVAGHTFIIGHWQSGFHALLPGAVPDWPADEGLCEGTADDPKRALWSRRTAPSTIAFWQSRAPDDRERP